MGIIILQKVQKIQKDIFRGHPDLNQGPIDLQSIALPLSYIPDDVTSKNHLPVFFDIDISYQQLSFAQSLKLSNNG